MSYRIYFLVSRVSTQCRSRTYPVASGPPYNALNAAVSQLCLLHYLLRLWLSTKMPLCATPHSTAPIMQLAQFVALCHAQSFRPSRITSYVSAIAYVHKIKGLLNLGEAFLVKKLLHGTRRSQCIDKRHPFTLTQIRILITALPSVVSSKYKCILFSVMFLTAFFALLRVGEFRLSSTGHQNMLTWYQLTFQHVDSKISSALLKISHYKHSHGQQAFIPLARQTVLALLRYRKRSPFKSGPLFHARSGNPISCTHFRTVLRECVIRSHLDPSSYTGHSLRIGGATQAHSQQIPLEFIKRLGRWKSQAFLRYIRPNQLQIRSQGPPNQSVP